MTRFVSPTLSPSDCNMLILSTIDLGVLTANRPPVVANRYEVLSKYIA